MSSFRRAAPSLESQQTLTREMMARQEPGAWRDNTRPQTYPYIPFAVDPRDTDEAIRAELLNGDNNVMGQMPVGEDYIAYIKSKRAQVEAAQFRQWTRSLFDMTNPVVAEYVRTKLDPAWFEEEEKYLNAALDNAKKFTLINMRGIRSMDDLKFLWSVNTGQEHVPSGFLPQELTQPLEGTGPDDANFTVKGRGLFNGFRWLGFDRPAAAPGYNQSNPINPWVTRDVNDYIGKDIRGFFGGGQAKAMDLPFSRGVSKEPKRTAATWFESFFVLPAKDLQSPAGVAFQ